MGGCFASTTKTARNSVLGGEIITGGVAHIYIYVHEDVQICLCMTLYMYACMCVNYMETYSMKATGMWVVVKIMVHFWFLSIILQLVFEVPKRGP